MPDVFASLMLEQDAFDYALTTKLAEGFGKSCQIWLASIPLKNVVTRGAVCDHVNRPCMHQLPVKPEEGVPDLFQLVPLKPGHLGVMPIPVVVAIAGLTILIACTRQVTAWLPNPNRAELQATGKSTRYAASALICLHD